MMTTGPRLQACRSCGEPIFYALTVNGKAMPVDAKPDPDGRLQVYQGGDGSWRVLVGMPRPGMTTHRPHFATCPDAERWRRGR